MLAQKVLVVQDASDRTCVVVDHYREISHARYRLDRYHLIESRALADSLAGLLDGPLSQDAAVHPLNAGRLPKTADLRAAIVRFRRTLAHSRYAFASAKLKPGEIGITPLLGLGTRDNLLNQTLLQLVAAASSRR